MLERVRRGDGPAVVHVRRPTRSTLRLPRQRPVPGRADPLAEAAFLLHRRQVVGDGVRVRQRCGETLAGGRGAVRRCGRPSGPR
ncbi:hypothetical protein BM536_005580 [Streptomyces phaeoluteigriseus]|uniref:Uncharacterized protein n=1 Tax=Streptomyces phaeoluteigriseus TaxID=114686 RepID=A0A1V6MWL8_9ACTN|nr:hypothetical protein [Streptomyces phaeoluteigriseus]OQD56861.1 hypothetical protein BM536_005580 [Streptomyces phaeoluteigriseus]